MSDYWFEERYRDAYFAIHGEFAPEPEEES